jgi:hypothetical protein
MSSSDEKVRRFIDAVNRGEIPFSAIEVDTRRSDEGGISSTTRRRCGPCNGGNHGECESEHVCDCDMHYCRKLFASHLRASGIQPEIVDLLQGRVSSSILTRHYLVPAPSFKEDILQALEQLQRQL